MDARLAEIKLEALLHDPPGKAPTLWYRRHEDFSARLVATVLDRPPQHGDLVKEADRYASAVDRSGLLRDPIAYRVDFLADPQIVHPLSGTRHPLEPLRNLDPGGIEDEQGRVVEEIVRAAGGPGTDPERLYWHVWRGLEDALSARGDIGKLWRHLPADTRVPDHSIWDHMRLAAAFAGALPAPALLLFSFGPVQSLIEAARRTGDLWAGSFLLSWLAWRAMEDLVARHGADALLFPDLRRQPLVDRWLAGRGWDIPGLSRAGQIASMPNRFLALVPLAEGKDLAEACESGLHAAAREFASGAVGELLETWEPAARDAAVSRATEQAATALTCQWHVLPWQPLENGLRERSLAVLAGSIKPFWDTLDRLAGASVYRPNLGTYFAVHSGLVEAAHGAAKALRAFAQIAETGRRCTVCGTREALWDARSGGKLPAAVRPEERLCGLCAARRQAPRGGWARAQAGDAVLFPSTHNLAATRFLEKVLESLSRDDAGIGIKDENGVAEALERFLDVANRADAHYATAALVRKAKECGRYAEVAQQLVKLPAELLDPTTYGEADVLEQLGLAGTDKGHARSALHSLLQACDRVGIPRAGRYYAVLVADGDHMGKWLSGQLAPTIAETLHEGALPRDDTQRRVLEGVRRPLSSAHQAAVSRALNDFSLEIVERVVEQVHGGVVVYAGGDDLLAMLPLHAALPCLRDLRRLYAGLPLHPGSRAARGGFEGKNGWVRRGAQLWRVMGDRATYSMGVAIAHQKWPLRHTLETAREMERLAKSGLRRNALAVALMKRSGGHERFAARWGDGDLVRDPDPLEPIEQIAELIETDSVSRRFAYALREEVRTLWGLDGALRDRAYWLLERHWRKRAAPFDPGRALALADDLQDLARFLEADPLKGERAEDQPAQRFVAALGLADFIARGGAEGE
jgi:CRISPR-associated protein Cmr2